MKKEYIKPVSFETEMATETMLALSTDRIPVGDGVKPSTTKGQRGEWGNLWQ